MPLSIKVTPLSISYQVFAEQTLSPKARNDKIAAAARQIIGKADEKNRQALGYVPPKTVHVNGREDDSLTNIVPPDQGAIVAEYRLVEDVLAWIMQTLRERSPVVSGEYRDGHKLFADDVEVSADKPPMASRYSIFNVVPYARRLEIGKTKSGRDFLIQVPNRIYARTAADAKAKFGNIAKITTGFASVPGAYQLKRSTGRRKSRRVGAVVTAPAIYVTIG